MRKFAITNIDIDVWTHKKYLPQVSYLYSLTKTTITRQRTFEHTEIEYY